MTLTALLLTGGVSSRMGREKATLEFGGEPLWARQIARLGELQPREIWVSARARPAWLPPNVEVVLDHPPSRGPLSGIAVALDRMDSSHLLALAVDLPRMTSEHLRKLTAMAQPGCGVIPREQDHLEPLAAIYPKEAAALAQSTLGSDDVSLHGLARKLLQQSLLRAYHLTPEELPLYFNVNTPRDLG